MITVENLRKTFGSKVAVDGVSFEVKKGEVLGFLGPNGAGKSTTMRMITGYLQPTDGKIRVGDYNMWEKPIEAKRLIGYLPENAPLYEDMTVSAFLGFVADLRGLRGVGKSKAVDKAIETCFLQSVRHQSIETLSKGYRHRTCFAQSIIHDPEVLILDEPTDGLDPNQKHEVRSLIRRMGEDKVIIFSTHILEEVEAACTSAIIIDRGRIVAKGTPNELKNSSPRSGAVVVRIWHNDSGAVQAKLQGLDGVSAVEILEKSSEVSTFRAMPKADVAFGELSLKIVDALGSEKWKCDEIHTEEGRLDEVFRKITMPDTEVRKV